MWERIGEFLEVLWQITKAVFEVYLIVIAITIGFILLGKIFDKIMKWRNNKK